MQLPPRPDDTDGVRLALDEGVATLTLSNPRRKNAITPPMWGELTEAFRWMAHDDTVRAVVVTGEGDDFCSGADLSDGPKVHATAYMRYLNEGPLALHSLAKPTIARVDGIAAGAGLNLALGCDLIVASDRARFSEIFARRALSIDYGGSWLLPRRVGLGKAKELALLADIVDAAEAQRIGLVNKVVPVGELDAAVGAWAARLAAGPPIALAQTKAMLDASSEMSLAQALEAEAAAQAVNFGTKDTAEAIQAFLQKRTPTYRGR
ncbi:MAG: enoyl-CoA hydratase-related protein [Acidimicrobiales bacterium]